MFNQKLTKLLVVLGLVVCTGLGFGVTKLLQMYGQVTAWSLESEHWQRLAELAVQVSGMGESLQEYLLWADPEALDLFHRYSNSIAQKQQELSFSIVKSAAQDFQLFGQLCKDYQNFALYQVVPAVQAGNNGLGKKADIYRQNREMFLQLQSTLENVRRQYSRQMDEHRANLVEIRQHMIILTSLLAGLMVLLVYLLHLLLTPLWQRYLFTSQLAQYSDQAVLFIEAGGKIIYINPAAQELFRLFPEQMLQKHLEDIPRILPRLYSVIQPAGQVLINQKKLLRCKVAYTHDDGRPVELTADYVPVAGAGRPRGVVLMIRPAGERKDRHLLLDTLERERKRISLEIHDWIARYMSTIMHALDYTLRLHQSGRLPDSELVRNLGELRIHCQNAAIEMRGIMNDIHPYLIDRVGLVSALESYVTTFEKLHDIKVYIFYQDRALRVRKKDEIIIYRIIQEALSNIVKHSSATAVDINFTRQKDTLRIEITDNGGGEGDFLAGQGLWGMKERASLIGGDVVFGYGETGFCVTLTVPLLVGGQSDEQDQDHAD